MAPHTNNIAAKANRTLNFLKHNLSCCTSDIKATAYITIVRSIMEYNADIWNPFRQTNIQQLEKVRCRAARWVMNDFNCYSSVTAMVEHLSWPSLETGRRLQTALYKINHQHYPLPIPPHFISMERSTRLYHPSCFVVPNSHINKASTHGNNLPSMIVLILTLFQLDCVHCIHLNYIAKFVIMIVLFS